MSNSKISADDRVIKHLRRAETALNNLESLRPDIKIVEFIEYLHNLRLQLSKPKKPEFHVYGSLMWNKL